MDLASLVKDRLSEEGFTDISASAFSDLNGMPGVSVVASHAGFRHGLSLYTRGTEGKEAAVAEEITGHLKDVLARKARAI